MKQKTYTAKALALLLTAAVTMAGLSACGSTSGGSADDSQDTAGQTESGAEGTKSGAETAGGEITFTYIRAASTTSLDLHTEVTANNAFAIDKIFEPLVMFDEEGGIYDFLAESHEISDDGTVYTFTLRDGVTFSDGTPLTAADVKFSIERHLEIGGSLPIQADIVSVEAASDDTVVITLSQAFTPFLSELANFSNGIIPENYGGKTEEEFFKNPVGTGPFVIETWDPAGDMVFVKNPCYRQEGQPTIDRLIYKVVDDENQAINQLRAGEADAVEPEAISYAAAKELEEGSGTYVITGNGWTVEEIFFNTLDEHFNDVHVRRALALTLDRQAIIDSQTYGYAVPANTVLPAALRYNTNDTVESLTLNLEKAKEELSLSAYPNGFETTINVPSGNNTRLQEAQILQAAAQEIGIQVDINRQELAVFREDFKALNYSIMINSAVADYPDADSIFAFQVDPEGFSNCYWTSYYNEEAVNLLHEGQTAPDGEERAAVYASLQQLLADEVPYIPLYCPENTVGVRDGVEGLKVLPNGSVSFNEIRFAD